MEIAGLSKIPIAMNVTLDKRKSKLVNVKGSTGLLDISSLPELTRNVSETQLLALRTAGLFLNFLFIHIIDNYYIRKHFLGTKALNNMSEQFSKLNKLSQTFSTKKPIDLAKNISNRKEKKTSKPVFTVGNRDISGNEKKKINSSSSSDDEDIVGKHIHLEKPVNFSHDKHLMEAYTPSIGIIMGVKDNIMDGNICANDVNSETSTVVHDNLNLNLKPDMAVDALLLISQAKSDITTLSTSPQKTTVTTPEITVYDESEDLNKERERIIPAPTSILSKNFSHSTGEVDNTTLSNNVKNTNLQSDSRLGEKKRSASEQDLTLSITSSQSESALKSIKENIASVTSPVASTAKDILSPFSKLAKGVQTLGANLDPRKLKTGQVGLMRNLSEQHLEERQKLQQRWVSCQSRLIAL